MTPTDVLRRASDYLDRHGVESPRTTAEILLAAVLETDRAGLYARREGLSAQEARMFGRAICQRCTGAPLQHLTGDRQFRRLTIEVRPGVFIPRPETEVLVGSALEMVADVQSPVVVDVGTGTGAVALAIAHERPDARVLATDLSPEAVDLARDNARKIGLAVEVLEGDLLAPLPEELRGLIDLVVSNPPYVTPEEYQDLPAEVRAEPDLALLGGVEVYERLAEAAASWLRPGGGLALEIGSGQAGEVVARLEPRFDDVRVLPDLAGWDRIVVGRRR